MSNTLKQTANEKANRETKSLYGLTWIAGRNVLTFAALDARSAACGAHAAAHLLEIDVAVAILVEGQENAGQCRRRHRRTDHRAQRLQIQLSGFRRALQRPEHLLQIADILFLEMRDAGQALIERRRLQFGGQIDARIDEQPSREHGGALVTPNPCAKLIETDAFRGAEQRCEHTVEVRLRFNRPCAGIHFRQGLICLLDLQRLQELQSIDARAGLIAIDVPQEPANKICK